MLESVEGGGWIERTRPEETEPGAASVPRCCERSLCSALGLWGKGEDRNIRTVAEELQCNTRVVFFFFFFNWPLSLLSSLHSETSSSVRTNPSGRALLGDAG